jgi:hypothetical protein
VETNIQWNQKRREKDEYSMDIARKQGYIQKHMRQISQVRMYLKVITLADITEKWVLTLRHHAFNRASHVQSTQIGTSSDNFLKQVGIHGTDEKHY